MNIIGRIDGAIIATFLAIANKDYLRKIILLGVTLKPEQLKLKWMDWIQEEYKKHQYPLFKLMIEEPQIEFKDLETINIPTLIVATETMLWKLRKILKSHIGRIPVADSRIMYSTE